MRCSCRRCSSILAGTANVLPALRSWAIRDEFEVFDENVQRSEREGVDRRDCPR